MKELNRDKTKMHEQALRFLLVPDGSAARPVRRLMAEPGACSGVVVGSWPELVGWVRRAYHNVTEDSELPIDPPSNQWLGCFSDREKVRRSGLWNSNHADEAYEPGFLEVFKQRVAEATTLTYPD